MDTLTTPRTIPVNPQPGERYAEYGSCGWRVWLMGQKDGVSSYIIYGLTETDARLLVFGAKAVAALAWYGEQSRLARLIHSEGDAGRHAIAKDGGTKARAALADLEVPR